MGAMADMESSDEPSTKRRKLTVEEDGVPLPFPQRFITLAKASVDLQPAYSINEERVRTAIDESSRSDVRLKDYRGDLRRAMVLLSSPSGNKALPLLERAGDAPVGSRNEQVLRDAVRLDSVWKHEKNTVKMPLVCHNATLTRNGDGRYKLEVKVLWQDTVQAQDSLSDFAWELLKRYQPESSLVRAATPLAEEWSPRDFYEHVHVPEKSLPNSAEIKIGLLRCHLYPFQRRAVRWLLSKEGAQVEESGQVTNLSEKAGRGHLPDFFRSGTDADGRKCFVSHGLGIISTDSDRLRTWFGPATGGILAEEMGLGKTVELLALMCLHQRDQTSSTKNDHRTPRPSGATLIITPPPILEQWKQEIAEHAPSLRVYHYDGMRTKARRRSELELIDVLASQDVVLTTYNVIAREIHYVAEKPNRGLRHKPRAEPPKSPLTEISWWRVCLDEAQMIESGVSAAAQVARLIPRENAWAVSGTPLKRDHKDLFGLLLFLQYEPWCQSLKLWNRLVGYHKPLFRKMLSSTSIRHSKDNVREDLRLPPQSRHTITVPFTAIEEQHYAQMFHQMCEECGLNREGAPLAQDWDPDASIVVEKMRSWLTRLRQTCLHPEVGGRNRRALGRSGGPLRSVLEVLEVMIDQNDSSLRIEQRVWLMSRIRRGQMLENAKRPKEALDIWQAAFEESCMIVEECRLQLDMEIERQKQETDVQEIAKPRGDNSDDNDDDEEAELDPRLTTYRQRLRGALEVKHVCIFFLGNVYFQIKTDETSVQPDSEDFKAIEAREETAYEEAKSIRSELLRETLKKANRSVAKVRDKAYNNSFVSIPTMRLELDYSGIESRKVFEKFYKYCKAMNEQAGHISRMRDKMIDFLRQSLIDEDEGVELKGDEYEASTKLQDEMYAYMEVLRALYADRNDVLTGQTNTLIAHEMKVAIAGARQGEGPAPEVLMTLLAEREKLRVPTQLGSIRGIIAEIRHLTTALQWQEGGGSTRARAELEIANGILQAAQKMSSAQSKAVTALESEVKLFRDTMNNRLDYYRALQKVSDTVAPYQEEKQGQPLNEEEFGDLLRDEHQKSNKISTLLSKRRYLSHLRTEQDSSAQSQRICTICQGDFENGTLTVCGHQFCKDCIRLWWSEKRTCPVCKRDLKAADFYDITYKPAEMAIQEESAPASPDRNSSPSSSSSSLNRSIYSDISTATLNQIKNVDLDGSYFGTKVDTICRHLYWLREHDPGSKAIIFSQYREFLDVLGRAFAQYKISFTRFDDKDGIEKFKSDPAVECFLLHAKAHSTGLNLVAASHVFLCEPLINTAIELQAIARVHRIGQQRSTTVWMYLVSDTVEESIYDISVTRRLAHMKRKQPSASRSGTATPNPNGVMESIIDAANSLELQAADLTKLLTAGKSGGEYVDKDDLWTCLYGRVRKRDAGFSTLAEAGEASGEVGRFLRAEAAEGRQSGSTSGA